MVSTYVAAALLLSASLIGLAEGERKPRPVSTVPETRERANFDCPEEFGYYPHPSDCTQYYVCVFGGALLESCTGGLMYSQELQTCDWPRNVGCDGLESAAPSQSAPCTNCGSQSTRSRERERPRERERDESRVESRTKYSHPPPPPPPQPKAVVTSRGQPRQLQSQQEIIKQQLYADVEESLPPAEEVESDRQQRVYRGQPSTVGQVQRDRDGYRHSNALPSYKDRGEKIGVISFGTQSQLQHYSTAPDLDEILTNDLTAKKRRKRNAQRSRTPYNDPTSWFGVQGNRYHHTRPYLEHPKRKPVVAGYNNQEEFQPFVPSYALSSNQIPGQYPTSNNFQYFNPNTHLRPVPSGTVHNYAYVKVGNSPPVQNKYRGAPIRHTVEYNYNNRPPNILEAAYSNIVSQAIAVEPKRIRVSNRTRTHTDALTKGFVQQDKSVQHNNNNQVIAVKNEYLEPARAETKKSTNSDGDRDQKDKENHEENISQNYEQKRPVSYYTKERPKIYKEELQTNFEEEREKNFNEEAPKSYMEESEKKYDEEKIKTHKEERPTNFDSERPKSSRKDRPNHNKEDSQDDENKDQKSKQSAAHIEKYEESPEKDTDNNKGEVDSDDPKEPDSEVKDDEVDDDKPKNSTTSYEYHSTEIDDDELGPPPEFYNDKNKYEDIHNPFEDPNFDFDSFLARLGSTTSTTTTSTTTTTTTTVRPKPKKIQQIRQEPKQQPKQPPKQIKKIQIETYEPLPGGLIPANNYATPAPNAHTKPVKEELGEDYLDDTNRKQLYSSQIKTGVNKTLPKSDEYEYYYEEYDYPEPSSSNKELSKLANLNKTDVKYSSKYQEKPLATLVSEATKNLPTYNISSHIEEYLINPASVPVIKDDKNVTLQPNSTLFANSTEHFNNIFGPDQFLIETSVITTPATNLKKTLTSDSKRNIVRTTSKPLKQTLRPTTTVLDVPDSKQEQSNIITSEDKNTQAPTAATATARTLYNSSQYNNVNQNDNRYDPYYALYDEDVELYKDVDYPAQNNNYNTNTQGTRGSTSSVYRGSPAVVREESSKRGNAVYNNVNQDIYQQPSTVSDYNDNSYQVDDTAYRQSSRAPTSLRGDRNEINEVEEIPTTKRSTPTTRKLSTTTPRITTTTQARTLPPKKITTTPASQAPVTTTENQTQALSNNTNPGHIVDAPKSPTIPTKSTTQNLLRPSIVDTIPDFTLHETYAVVKKPTPFLLAQHLTTVKPAFHFITKAPKSTHQISSSTINKDNGINQTTLFNNVDADAQSSIRLKIIIPTTYSPPKYLLRSILPQNSVFSSAEFSFRPKNQSRNNNLSNKQNYQYKTLKAVRKLINPITVNHELSTSAGATYESAEDLVDNYDFDKSEELNNFSSDKTDEIQFLDARISPNYTKPLSNTTPTTTISPKTINFSTTTDYIPTSTNLASSTNELTTTGNASLKSRLYALLSKEKLGNYIEDEANSATSEKRFKINVEIPPPRHILDEDIEKLEPDQPPSHKPKPITIPIVDAKADFPVNTSYPPRVSRVNAAIKSLIAIAGTKGPTKCSEKGSKCKVEAKQRTPARGRGSSHYTNSGSITSNEVTVNRGTPAPRSRPTLKPSTSIVSKATEFVDIYKYPPRRPGALYPQPQPDKTAAKCRKDVCLLPDCSCGGKEIPGDIPVEHVPQMVLLTFDDSVNDLNKGLYQDLFEKGRTNPNGCPIAATFYVSHEWTDYSQVQNLYSDGHELASHTVSHSFGEQFSQKKWTREVAGQREILAAYGGVKLEDVKGMRAPFLSVGGNKMFKMLYDSNFTYDSSMPIYENKPPSWPYTLDYKLFHDCMIPPCPTRSYPGVWEVPMVMWQDLNGGRCSMGDACSNPPDADGVFKMLLKNFERHYTTNRAPFGLFYHAAWFTQAHHKEGFINFIDTILAMKDVWFLTNWQALQWVRDPTPTSRLNNFQPFQCEYSDRPKRCNNPKVCNLWHKSGVRYMRTCQPCPDIYPWTGNSGIRSSRVDNDIED